ncbi:MAG: MBL fold metallo-hydrolase [Myxococcota bacterium]|nr:MBL fold metallo-hydrolase [Myxococcota bacterium]
MIFRQLFDRESCTYTYLLADPETREALLIDPVRAQVERDVSLLEELGLTLKYTLETHVHADHVTSAGLLRRRTGCQSVVSSVAGARCADIQAEHGRSLQVGSVALEVRHTPGHTNGCVSYVLADQTRVFTGDALFIRGCGRTDFQQGDARRLHASVHEQIFTLPDECAVYPGHDYNGRTVSSVAEERRHNPRLGGGRSADEFVQVMDALVLSDPAHMAVAVPANLQCGWLPGDEPLRSDPRMPPWAPLVRNADGVPEVSAVWTHANLSVVRVIDVRRPDEWTGELGHAVGSQLIPLDNLGAAAATWDRDAPCVVICRSGGRSGRAARLLEGLGFRHVASMAGGMLEWRSQGFEVAR